MKFKRKKKSFFLHRLKQKHYPLLFRRLAFLWVFLIILEIGCPIFESQSFAAEIKTDDSAVSNTIALKADYELQDISANENVIFQDNSITADNYSVADHRFQNEDCTDECLCHITPVNVSEFIMPKDFQPSSVTPIKIKFQPSSDLLPPYQPPQFS